MVDDDYGNCACGKPVYQCPPLCKECWEDYWRIEAELGPIPLPEWSEWDSIISYLDKEQ